MSPTRQKNLNLVSTPIAKHPQKVPIGLQKYPLFFIKDSLVLKKYPLVLKKYPLVLKKYPLVLRKNLDYYDKTRREIIKHPTAKKDLPFLPDQCKDCHISLHLLAH